jgi:hypothetical protein
MTMADRRTYRLRVTQGDEAGQTFNLEKDISLIGRTREADIVLANPRVSRLHARIIRQDGNYSIEDAGSANGTYLNGQRLAQHEPQPLSLGVEIDFGKVVTLKVEVVAGADPEQTILSSFRAPLLVTAVTGSTDESEAVPPPPVRGLRAGSRLDGHYEIHNNIGRGAFGQVYLAYDIALKRKAAIKEVIKGGGTGYQSFEVGRQKFEREAYLMGKFNHPNIVTVYQLIQHQDSSYLALEYVEKGSLKDLLTTVSPLPVDRSLQIAIDICQALVVLEQAQIVHRDIKPSNILLTSNGAAKLADFGIAQSPESGRPTQKHPGTPKYKSPEQETSSEMLDSRSDLYTLGLILYELVTGKPYKAVRLPARKANPAVSAALQAVLNKALDPNLQKRFQSPPEMLDGLKRLSDRKGRTLLGR